MVTIYVMRLW